MSERFKINSESEKFIEGYVSNKFFIAGDRKFYEYKFNDLYMFSLNHIDYFLNTYTKYSMVSTVPPTLRAIEMVNKYVRKVSDSNFERIKSKFLWTEISNDHVDMMFDGKSDTLSHDQFILLQYIIAYVSYDSDDSELVNSVNMRYVIYNDLIHAMLRDIKGTDKYERIKHLSKDMVDKMTLRNYYSETTSKGTS